MKRLITTLLVMGMFLTTTALADDADDVKAAAYQYYVALNIMSHSTLGMPAPMANSTRLNPVSSQLAVGYFPDTFPWKHASKAFKPPLMEDSSEITISPSIPR